MKPNQAEMNNRLKEASHNSLKSETQNQIHKLHKIVKKILTWNIFWSSKQRFECFNTSASYEMKYEETEVYKPVGVSVFFSYFSTTNSTASVKDEKRSWIRKGDKMEEEVYNYGKAGGLERWVWGCKVREFSKPKKQEKDNTVTSVRWILGSSGVSIATKQWVEREWREKGRGDTIKGHKEASK